MLFSLQIMPFRKVARRVKVYFVVLYLLVVFREYPGKELQAPLSFTRRKTISACGAGF